MADVDILYSRLHNQCITAPTNEEPSKTVAWFGAMQAQDFAAAKWAIGLRTKGATDASIEQAFNEGKIIRTHLMRPTWHFVHPSDIRWLLALTSPRVQAFNGYYYRRSGFDKSVFNKSNEIIQKALQGGNALNRNEINILLQDAKIPTQDVGLSFALMQAELEGIICSGPRRSKQFTYMLLAERISHVNPITYEEALGELTKRYFQSHGPAQIQDFAWWSGITKTDAKKGIEMLGSSIQKQISRNNTYWYFATSLHKRYAVTYGFLLPGFDEYFIAYKDRTDILDKKYFRHLNMGGGMLNGAIVVGGKMIGGWKRIFLNKKVSINIKLFEKITVEQIQEITQTANRYGAFMGMQHSLHIESIC